MPEIKTSLKQLTALFAQSSANEELPMPIRRFAAQLTVLTAHVNRVEAKIDALGKSANAHIVELVQHVAALQQPPKTVAASQPETGEAPAASDEERGTALDEEDEAQALADRMLREADEEMKNANAAAVAKVTPLRPNGQQTPPTTEEAS